MAEQIARTLTEELLALREHANRTEALFRERLGERTRPTWFAVNALQEFVDFVRLWDVYDRIEALSPAQGEAVALRTECARLFDLLDDIDTLDDAARSDDAAFREQTRAIQRKRFDGGITTDGYTLDFTALTQAPAPTPEAPADPLFEDRGPLAQVGRNSIPRSHRGEGHNFID
jgi:hypothetical protein